MKNKILIAGIISLGIMAACNSVESKNSTTKKENQDNMETIDLKENALNGLHAFVKDYDQQKAKKYFKEDYIQHNPSTPQGLGSSLQMIPALKQAKTTVKTHRIFQDGDVVVMHNTLHNATPFGGDEFVVFDVYRMENGMVAEHWDAITPIVKSNFGNTQVDGETKVTDLDKTAKNKALAKGFVNDLFVNGKIETASQYISTEKYIQHNPMLPDGVDALLKGMQQMMTQVPDFRYIKAHHIWGEGNFVLVAGEGFMNGSSTIIYDLFRFEDEKIVEHWDIIQPIPAEKANSNGVF